MAQRLKCGTKCGAVLGKDIHADWLSVDVVVRGGLDTPDNTSNCVSGNERNSCIHWLRYILTT